MNNNPKNALVLVLATLFMIFLSPIHLLGLLTNYLPYKAPVWFVNNKVEDQHFHGSLKLAMGVIFFFIYWMMILIPLLIIKGWILAGGAFVLYPVIAIFNYRFWIILPTNYYSCYNRYIKCCQPNRRIRWVSCRLIGNFFFCFFCNCLYKWQS